MRQSCYLCRQPRFLLCHTLLCHTLLSLRHTLFHSHSFLSFLHSLHCHSLLFFLHSLHSHSFLSLLLSPFPPIPSPFPPPPSPSDSPEVCHRSVSPVFPAVGHLFRFRNPDTVLSGEVCSFRRFFVISLDFSKTNYGKNYKRRRPQLPRRQASG